MYNQQKMESIKEGAYFDYFKFFSINAAETIRKLQATIQEQLSEDVFFDANNMFKRIKTLLSSYELLILEINDSCEFVEIPEFGVCILKIFFQLMSIIRFMAKSIILRATLQKPAMDKEKRSDQRHTMLSPSASQFYQNSLNANSQGIKERENFRIKELASHMFKDLTKEVVSLEREQKAMSLENENTLEKISKGRERLQQIESSQSEAVLAEAVNILFKRGEHINNFLNVIQTNMNMQSKEGNNVENYSKIKELFDEEALPRFESAKIKLNQLFKEHVVNFQKKKKEEMVSYECQVKIEDEEPGIEEKVKNSLHNKKNSSNEQLKKLKNQLKTVEQQNKTLKNFIHQKSEEYENAITKLRSQKISLQNKLNAELKNIQKSKGNILKKSQTNIDILAENMDIISDVHSHLSFQSQAKEKQDHFEFNHTMKRSKVNLAGTKTMKSKVKFHIDRYLTICDKTVSFIANFPSEYQFNKDVFENQTGYFEIQQEKDSNSGADTLTNMKQMNKIYEHPQEYENTRRDGEILDNEDKLSSTLIMKNRVSCGVAGWNDHKQIKQNSMSYSDNGLLRIRKAGRGYNGYGIAQRVGSKHTEHEIEEQKERMDKINKDSILQASDVETQIKPVKMFSIDSINLNASSFKQEKKDILHTSINPKNSPTHSPTPDLYTKLPSKLTPTSNNTIIQKQLPTKYKLIESPIQFERQDLLSLFLSEENAQNYELLNVTLCSKTNQYINTLGNKNIIVKQIKVKQFVQTTPGNQFILGKEQDSASVSVGQLLIDFIYKTMKLMKQSRKQIRLNNYHMIKNFIRFPHSAVYKKHQNTWKAHEKDNNALEYLELKRYINRILKLHCYCKAVHFLPTTQISTPPSDSQIPCNSICEHWWYFLAKLGMDIPQ